MIPLTCFTQRESQRRCALNADQLRPLLDSSGSRSPAEALELSRSNQPLHLPNGTTQQVAEAATGAKHHLVLGDCTTLLLSYSTKQTMLITQISLLLPKDAPLYGQNHPNFFTFSTTSNECQSFQRATSRTPAKKTPHFYL